MVHDIARKGEPFWIRCGQRLTFYAKAAGAQAVIRRAKDISKKMTEIGINRVQRTKSMGEFIEDMEELQKDVEDEMKKLEAEDEDDLEEDYPFQSQGSRISVLSRGGLTLKKLRKQDREDDYYEVPPGYRSKRSNIRGLDEHF